MPLSVPSAEARPQLTVKSDYESHSTIRSSNNNNGDSIGDVSDPPSPQSPLLPFSSCSTLPSSFSRASRSIPRIIITPAPPQHFREMSSCVPVQDTSFGSRLTVPSHSALNASHPPLVAPCYPHALIHVSVRAWTYKYGHWCAVAPGIEEQERRGIFSRPMSSRRRALKRLAATPRCTRRRRCRAPMGPNVAAIRAPSDVNPSSKQAALKDEAFGLRTC